MRDMEQKHQNWAKDVDNMQQKGEKKKYLHKSLFQEQPFFFVSTHRPVNSLYLSDPQRFFNENGVELKSSIK